MADGGSGAFRDASERIMQQTNHIKGESNIKSVYKTPQMICVQISCSQNNAGLATLQTEILYSSTEEVQHLCKLPKFGQILHTCAKWVSNTIMVGVDNSDLVVPPLNMQKYPQGSQDQAHLGSMGGRIVLWLRHRACNSGSQGFISSSAIDFVWPGENLLILLSASVSVKWGDHTYVTGVF